MRVGRYAANTEVSAERSRAEIEQVLARYGADKFLSGWAGQQAVIGFQCHDRLVRFMLTLPDRADRQFTRTEARGQLRTQDAAVKAWEQACRQRWRALCLCIKAKLEAVESEIESFEEAFMGHIVLPGDVTVGDWLAPQIDQAYKTGVLPQMLPMLPAPNEAEVLSMKIAAK